MKRIIVNIIIELINTCECVAQIYFALILIFRAGKRDKIEQLKTLVNHLNRQ